MKSLITGSILSILLGFWLSIFTWPFTPFDHENFIAYIGYGGVFGGCIAVLWFLLWFVKYRDDF